MTTVGLPDTFTYAAGELVSCLIVSSARAYGSQVRFIRSASAKPLVLLALDPQDGSNSSSLTSINDSLLTSPQLHTRKVAGSIPAWTTHITAAHSGLASRMGISSEPFCQESNLVVLLVIAIADAAVRVSKTFRRHQGTASELR
jgi:hypothetical protein